MADDDRAGPDTADRPQLGGLGWRLGERDDELGEALIGFLDALPRRPQLLGLGEPLHLAEEFPRLRNRVFAQLVQRAGYRSIAIESDCLAGLVVDDHVAGGPGALDAVMATGFSHGGGAYAANRELVAWMRERNAAHDPRDRVRFAGFDAPLELMSAAAPRPALLALHGYLAAHLGPAALPADAAAIERLAGPDAPWRDPAPMLDPARSVGGRPEVGEQQPAQLLGQPAQLAEAPRLVAGSSGDAWQRADLHGRTAAGLLRYHATMAEDTPQRLGRMAGQRDALMADNLRALREAEADRGPTLVFAHNRHLQREPSTWQLGGVPLRWWSAGAISSALLGDRCAVVLGALGRAPERGLGAPAPGTAEGALAALGEPAALVDARRLRAALDTALDTATDTAGRGPAARTGTTTDQGYFPLDPDHLADADGIVFLDRVGPAVPVRI